MISEEIKESYQREVQQETITDSETLTKKELNDKFSATNS